MIVNEAHNIFRLEVDKTASFNNPNFLDDEVDFYLSEAQEEFIEQRAWGNNFKRETLEQTQKRVSDLQSITSNYRTSTFITNTDNKPNGKFVPLPQDYRHSIQEELQIVYKDCNQVLKTTILPVIALTHDKYNTTIANPFSAPSINKAYRLPFGRFNGQEHFEIITSPAHTPQTYILRYLKNPLKFNLAQRIIPPAIVPFGLSGNQTIEMSDESCREIIRIAVRNSLGDIESPNTPEAIKKLTEQE